MSFAALNEYVALEIFHAFVAVDHYGPYTLIQVSTLWKDITFRTSVLWTYIYLDDSSPDWEQCLAISLALSQERSLHVTVRAPFIHVGALKSIVPRWKTLEIRLSSHEGIGDIAEAILRILERDYGREGMWGRWSKSDGYHLMVLHWIHRKLFCYNLGHVSLIDGILSRYISTMTNILPYLKQDW
jgi:hypothetical protein